MIYPPYVIYEYTLINIIDTIEYRASLICEDGMCVS